MTTKRQDILINCLKSVVINEITPRQREQLEELSLIIIRTEKEGRNYHKFEAMFYNLVYTTTKDKVAKFVLASACREAKLKSEKFDPIKPVRNEALIKAMGIYKTYFPRANHSVKLDVRV